MNFTLTWTESDKAAFWKRVIIAFLVAQALVSTNPDVSPVQIVEWFVQRWQLKVTFEEARAHLGIEIQRLWLDMATLRTTSVLLGLFSLVTLFAQSSSKPGTAGAPSRLVYN